MVCTLCGRDGHRASKCPYRPRFIDKVITIIALVFIVASYAFGHSWYDPDCCGGNDCEPISAIAYVASDASKLPVMMVTTSLGTKPVTAETKVRESKDGRMHACIYQGRVLCIYMPPGT